MLLIDISPATNNPKNKNISAFIISLKLIDIVLISLYALCQGEVWQRRVESNHLNYFQRVVSAPVDFSPIIWGTWSGLTFMFHSFIIFW